MVLRLYSCLPAQLHNHLVELEGVITSSTSCLYFNGNTFGSSTKIIFCTCSVWTNFFFICANFVTAAVLYHVYHSHGLSLFSFVLTCVISIGTRICCLCTRTSWGPSAKLYVHLLNSPVSSRGLHARWRVLFFLPA